MLTAKIVPLPARQFAIELSTSLHIQVECTSPWIFANKSSELELGLIAHWHAITIWLAYSRFNGLFGIQTHWIVRRSEDFQMVKVRYVCRTSGLHYSVSLMCLLYLLNPTYRKYAFYFQESVLIEYSFNVELSWVFITHKFIWLEYWSNDDWHMEYLVRCTVRCWFRHSLNLIIRYTIWWFCFFSMCMLYKSRIDCFVNTYPNI